MAKNSVLQALDSDMTDVDVYQRMVDKQSIRMNAIAMAIDFIKTGNLSSYSDKDLFSIANKIMNFIEEKDGDSK